MQTGENSIIAALVYFIIVTRVHSKIQLYDVMVVY